MAGTSSDWKALKRAIVTEIPPLEKNEGPRLRRRSSTSLYYKDLHSEGGSAARPIQPRALQRLLSVPPLERVDLSEIIAELSAFDWFRRLPDAIGSVIASSALIETFDVGNLAIFNRDEALAAMAQLEDGDEEMVVVVVQGRCSVLQPNHENVVAGEVVEGELWTDTGGGELRAEEPATLMVVWRSAFTAVRSAKKDAAVERKTTFLQSVLLLEGVSRWTVRALAEVFTEDSHQDGSVVQRQGDATARVAFIVAGSLRAIRMVPRALIRRSAARVGDDMASPSSTPPCMGPAEAAADAAVRTQHDTVALEVGEHLPKDCIGAESLAAHHSAAVASASLVAKGRTTLLVAMAVDVKAVAPDWLVARLAASRPPAASDAEVARAFAEADLWSKYCSRVVEAVVAAERRGKRSVPKVHRRTLAAAAGRTGHLLSGDLFATPLSRTQLHDMAITSMRRTSSLPALPGKGPGRRPPPPKPVFTVIAEVDAAAVAAGASDPARRPGVKPTTDYLPAGHPKQGSGEHMWDQFQQWGGSLAGRARYSYRYKRHLADVHHEMQRGSGPGGVKGGTGGR